MLSKHQADVASDSLLKAAREQRERKAERNATFPELLKFPVPQRLDALRAARSRAWQHAAVVALCVFDALLIAAALRALLNDEPNGQALLFATIGGFLIMQRVHKYLTRKHLRAMLAD
jgi:hypothetical protein